MASRIEWVSMATPMRLRDLPPDVNDISGQVVDAAIEVHRALGPGLLESAYKACLAHELVLRGLRVEREVMLVLHYKGITVQKAYFVDMLVEGRIVVEAKAMVEWGPNDEAQLLTYMSILRAPVGILLNFHSAKLMKGGFKRLALTTSATLSAPLRDSAVVSSEGGE